MRWRVGVVLCLFAAYIGVGCRDPLTPNIDRNQAPETWITAAPFDTITLRDEFGRPVDPRFPGFLPGSNTIPVRFHVHWAGSDRDGAVSGFYWAVVETLPRAPVGGFFLPELPGPKPGDYRFTTRTDSFFIFNVAEDIPDRQHAFFIYAVDNLGKPDPTPARFIFTALDKFPPIPKFDDCICEGIIYDPKPGGGVTPRIERRLITDQDIRTTMPRDTCSATSTLTFNWHAEIQVPQTVVTGFKYKLDEPSFIEVGPEVTSAVYNSGIPPDNIPPIPGTKIFLLRAIDQAGGSADSTRRFQLNFAPDTWWSGPDPNSSSWLQKPNGEKYILFVNGVIPPPGIPGSLMSADSVRIFPADRPAKADFRDNTFMEIWKDTLFLRHEGDTVHMNSKVVLHAGGFDKDSRYAVRLNPIMWALDENGDPLFPDFPRPEEAPILVADSLPNGSPIGFRSIITQALWPDNSQYNTAYSNVYPVFDPNDVFGEPHVAGYHPVFASGRAFAVIQAQDSDGLTGLDKRITDGRELVQRFEAGLATPYEQSLRGKVVTFHVNRHPTLVTSSPLFRPSVATVDTFYSPLWDLRLVATDEDPWRRGTPPGGPSSIVTLRRKLRVIGTHVNGGEFVYDDPTKYLNQQNITLVVPPQLAPGPATLVVELCDCDLCEDEPGTGRCATWPIPVYYQPTAPGQPAP